MTPSFPVAPRRPLLLPLKRVGTLDTVVAGPIRQRTEAVLATVSGKWTLRLLSILRDGPVRLSQLCRMLPGVSKKVLVVDLRRLESCGFVERRDLSGRVRHVEYELVETRRGGLVLLMDHLESLGEQMANTPRL